MGAGATTQLGASTDLELSVSDSLSTFDSLAQSSTVGNSMSLRSSWHADYLKRSRSVRIREDDLPHKLAISFDGSGRTLMEDDDDWIAVEETQLDDEHWERKKLKPRPRRLDESYRLTESGTILLREMRIKTSGNDEESDVSVVDRCVLLGPLGAGSGGRVHKALDLTQRRLVAVKAIPVHDRNKRRQLVAELKALKSTTAHEETHVIKILDCYAHAPSDAAWLVVEYADGGSVQDFVERGGSAEERVIACLGVQVAKGLQHVHASGYAHRDVKPSNILLERSGVARLADFGIAAKCDDASTRTFIGTAQYMSPERIKGDAYSTAADIWGLGVSLLAVARGAAPFGSTEKDNDDAEYWQLVGEVVEAPIPALPHAWSADATTCVASCLAKDARERPTAQELLAMAFLTEAPGPAAAFFFPATERNGRQELDEALDAVASHFAERAALCRPPGAVSSCAGARALFTAGGFEELARQLALSADDVEDAVRERLGPREAASPEPVRRRSREDSDSVRLTAELAKELESSSS